MAGVYSQIITRMCDARCPGGFFLFESCYLRGTVTPSLVEIIKSSAQISYFTNCIFPGQ